MSYKTIAVSLNETGRLPQILAAARKLGSSCKAHVRGIYVIPAAQIYPMVGYDAVPEIYDGNRVFFQTEKAKVKEQFEAAMKADGIACAFVEIDGRTSQIANEVAEQGRSADLVALAASKADGSSGVETDFAERVVMLAGRPVLLLPREGDVAFGLDEILLGWDNGREAARAVFDAMPLLRIAKKVRVVGIDVAPKGLEPGADIAETLAHHGVKAEVTHVSSDGMGAGDTLLRAANDFGSGLVVMGAYGHSRLTEFVFGGATRQVVKKLSRPVLMSH
jgi:nucleotide-binding universal stress UspA family protein